jgi:hypothetical protein
MNDGSAIDSKKLAELGADRLARLLAGVGERLPEVRLLVEIVLTMSTDTADAVKLINGELARLRASDRYLDWRELSSFAGELDLLLDVIVDHFADVDPARAFDCLCNFIEIAAEVVEHSDDDGYLSNTFEHAGTYASEILDRIPDKDGRVAAIARGEMTCRNDRIGVFDFHHIASAKLAIDRQIEHRAVTQAALSIQPEPDSPDLLRLKRALGANPPTRIPQPLAFRARIKFRMSHCLSPWPKWPRDGAPLS